MTDHPITPPPELVAAWCREADDNEPMFPQVAAKAAQWGADQELEYWVDWISEHDWTWTSAQLRAARRSEPQSLKDQALEDLHIAFDTGCFSERQADTIRRALEQLPQ